MNTNKRHFDHKTSSYAFLLIIFIVILLAFIIATLQESDVLDFNDYWASVGFTALQYVLFIGIFILVCKQSKISGPALYEEISLKKKINMKNLCLVLLLSGICIVGFLLATSAFGELCRVMGYVEKTSSIDVGSFERYIAAVVVFALMAAVVEESFFRGIILKGLLPFGKVQAVIASAVLFSIFHFNPSQTVFQFILGIVLAIIVLRTGNLVYAMILHFVNNFSVLTYTYIAGNYSMLLVWDWMTIVFTVVLALAALLFIWELLKELEKGPQTAAQKNEIQINAQRKKQGTRQVKFFSFENIGYFICIGLAGFIWVLQFVG